MFGMYIGCIYSVEDCSSSDRPMPSFSSIPFGISYVATSLKKAGHNVKMLVFTPQTDIFKKLNTFIEKNKPQLFCLTAVTSQYHVISDIAKKIKEIDSSIHTIIGGDHATLNPNETIKELYFDAICVGEGERAIVEYASLIERGVPYTEINNLWIKERHGRLIKGHQDSFIQDLDNLPYIDREMWDEWVFDDNRMHSVLLGRGCPNRCTYCSNHALSQASSGKYVRFRSHENVIDEMHSIVKRYPSVRSIFLEAETIGVNLKYTYEMCEHLAIFNLKYKSAISFGTNIAINKNLAYNEELLWKLKKVNFDFINIGLESGSEKVRNTILKRPKYSNKDIINFCNLAKKCGISANLFVLMGIPGETLSDYKETLDCVRECNPNHVYLSIFYPYPGTNLYSEAKKMGLLKADIIDTVMERRRAVLDIPGFSKKQINREYLLFPYKVYKRKKALYKILAQILRNYIGMHPGLNLCYRRVFNNSYLKVLQEKFNNFHR